MILFDPWVWQMAWRDSRRSRRRLFLFMSPIILGTAALVAINSLSESLERAIGSQAKSLLGADMLVESRQPFTKPVQQTIDSLARGGETATETSFSSMIFFPAFSEKNGGTRLAQIRAISGDFPFYGTLDTEPENARTLLTDKPFALIDNNLHIQFGAGIGDTIKVGAVMFRVAGLLNDVPGEAAVAAAVGPRVYIPSVFLDSTKLIQPGSRVTYKTYFKLARNASAKTISDSLKTALAAQSVTLSTAEDRQAALGRTLENLYRFLNLTGFIALLLGSVGVASAIHVYIKQKLQTVAVLRCVGARSAQMLGVYLAQSLAMGFIGASLGALLGLVLQTALPALLADFLPVDTEFVISGRAILIGLGIGLLFSMSFALLPLLTVQHISPLLVLRSSLEDADAPKSSGRFWIYGLITLAVFLFASLQTAAVLPVVERLKQGGYFTLGIAAALGLLALAAQSLVWLSRKAFPASWKYEWRQGLSNLHRPNNQTLTLILALGFGTMLIATLYFLQDMLIRQVSLTSQNNQPNLVLFDVQPDQERGVSDVLKTFDAPVISSVPIVTMRLNSAKNKTVSDARKDSAASGAWFWEYRVTIRDSLTDSETLLKGAIGKPVRSASDSVIVSVSDLLADNLKLAVGDSISFDVQGVVVKAFVGSIRKIEFRRIQPAFSVVFPTGVIDDAPRFYALITRAETNDVSAKIQYAVVQAFPNVSAIDLNLILTTISGILDKISLVIRFMALFSIGTGITVLVGSILISRFQRMRESVLLRTLGAIRSQVIQIMRIEYLFLGLFSALVGLGLSAASSALLGYFLFNFTYTPPLVAVGVGIFVLVLLTLVIGSLAGRGAHSKPPLEILRSET
jgi:putative ABC transport system permease protein